MPDRTSFVVIAELSVSAEHKDEFLSLCRADADGSVRDEPGCRQFDVLTCAEEPHSVILFEVYDDAPAFEAHLKTPHYAAFDAGVQRLGVEKTRVRFTVRAHQGVSA